MPSWWLLYNPSGYLGVSHCFLKPPMLEQRFLKDLEEMRSRTPSVSTSMGRGWGAELCIHAALAGPELWLLGPCLAHPCSAQPWQLRWPKEVTALRQLGRGHGGMKQPRGCAVQLCTRVSRGICNSWHQGKQHGHGGHAGISGSAGESTSVEESCASVRGGTPLSVRDTALPQAEEE